MSVVGGVCFKLGVGGHHHAPAALPPGKTWYPLYRRLGGHQGLSGRVRKISPPTGIRSPDRPGRSETLYRLSYPGPPYIKSNVFKSDCCMEVSSEKHDVNKKVQLDATICRHLFTAKSLYMFPPNVVDSVLSRPRWKEAAVPVL